MQISSVDEGKKPGLQYQHTACMNETITQPNMCQSLNPLAVVDSYQ